MGPPFPRQHHALYLIALASQRPGRAAGHRRAPPRPGNRRPGRRGGPGCGNRPVAAGHRAARIVLHI